MPKEKRVTESGIPAYGANGLKCYANKPLHDKPSIIIGRKGSAGELQLVDTPFWALDVTYYAVFDDDKYDLKFIFYLLKSLDLPNLAKGIKPGLNRNDVYKKKVKVPNKVTQIQISKKLDVLASKKIAFLDVICNFANLSESRGYTRPKISKEKTGDSKGGFYNLRCRSYLRV